MSFRVLVPMDDSEMAERALEYALETHPDADVTVLTVVGVPSMLMGDAVSLALETDLDEASQEHAGPVLERARTIAAEHDREIDTVVGLGHPARVIVRDADDYDVIVMGSHGEHSADIARRFLVGSVAKEVFRRSPVPVTSVR
ncbi:universal stress protein UspA-like protein [Halovivax ruber XH-70]|uniref:Universal stress protein UspA-like protein n=1 Tax=Halovivax ruber (strain DSM 18193 / JCM 13892 / XH-70) TaxID=797302 RepID=L0IDR7_HALRX|nr:universal stress protein [Halovivax ruber]AGB17705.1 universal stress protein UspA-like protein [Halovivax ruber XH-70]